MSSATKTRKDIEGMRALAVGLVLLFHAGVPMVGGGYIGVDMFFVVSGYIITSMMLREQDENGKLSLANFWARRARRILPLSSIVVVATLLLGMRLLDDARVPSLINDSIFASLFSANILFAWRGGGYLTGLAPESPLLHFWSLAVEEQFYIFWPLLFAYLVKKGGDVRKGIVRFAVPVAILSLVASILITPINKGAAYYMLPTRLWELLAGCALAACGAGAARLPLRATGAWLGLGMLLWSAITFDTDTLFPSYLALIPVAGTVLLLNGKDHPFSVNRMLSCKPLVRLGAISYATYLLHWPMLKLWEGKYGEQNLSSNLIIVASSVALAALSYRILENPVRFNGKLVASHRKSIALGGVLVAVSLTVGLGASRGIMKAETLSFGPEKAADVTSHNDAKTRTAEPVHGEGSTKTAGPGGDLERTKRHENHQKARSLIKNPRVLLLGDSVLASSRWYPQSQVALEGFTYTLDAESCRRLSKKSCKGREGRVPSTVKEALRGYDGQNYDILVIMAGYHTTVKDIKNEFKSVISAAENSGFRKILWVNYRESLKFPLTGSNGTKSAYSTINAAVNETIAQENIDTVTVLDWNSYSKPFPHWFIPDDLHTTLNGTLELNRFLSLNIRQHSEDLCASTTTRCDAISAIAPGTRLLEFYKLRDTDVHCYEKGKTREKSCERDKALK